MSKVFDAPAGLPTKYTYGSHDSYLAQEARRRITNVLTPYGTDRGGLIIIRSDGSAKFKEEFPMEAVPEGSFALCFQSLYSHINPYIAGKIAKMPVFGAGISYGKTAFHPEDTPEELVGSELNLIRDINAGVGYERCWEFLLRTARHLESTGVSGVPAPTVAPLPERRPRRDDQDIMADIDAALGDS